MNKKILATAIIGAVGISSVIGVLSSPVLAEDLQTYPPIVNNIAEKFNLNQAEVHEVMVETHKSNKSERLTQLVEEQKITAEQKALIEKHQTEMQAQVEKLRLEGKTREQVREQMTEQHEAFEEVLEEQGIDDVMGRHMGRNGEKGFGEGRGQGNGQRGMGY